MRRAWATVLAVLAMVVAGPVAAASATDPIPLGDSFVADEAGVLSGGQLSGADATLAKLETDTGISLYVALVPEFTNPSDRNAWADAVAQDNGLGDRQYLLAIATEARQYTISASPSGPLSEDQLVAIEQSLLPDLRADDWAGAIDTAATGVRQAAGGGTPGSSGGGIPGFVWIILLLVVAAVIVFLVVRSRRKAKVAAGGTTPLEQLPLQDLERQAGSALVATDDAVKTSEEELGFARAQFGDEATGEFEAALAQAKENLNQAFTLKQKLDDSTPDSEADTRAWNAQIIELCTQAGALLDEKAAAFDELRKLEQNAPEALAKVQELRGSVEPRIAEAESALAALSARYAPSALATIADNPVQARQRLAFADDRLAEAQEDIGAGRGGEAAVGIRAAEEAVDQARLLVDAVGKLGQDLSAAEQSISALVANLQQDIAAASALPDADGRLASVIASTRQAVDAATAATAGAQLAPLQVLQSLEAANTQIDGAIAGIRDAQEQAERARQQLGQLLLQAQAQVSAAEDYITARRGAVGATARTRLAEAGASLVQAQQLQTTDPAQALSLAQRANQLAGQAIQSAQNDVGSFDAGIMGGGRAPAGGGDNVLGAVLGGIVINSMLGGGGGVRGGFGGASGSLGGGRGGGGGRTVRTPGSFGGGGTRGRRGGGRF